MISSYAKLRFFSTGFMRHRSTAHDSSISSLSSQLQKKLDDYESMKRYYSHQN